MNKFYELVSHTADLGIRVKSKTLPGIYINSAKALFDLIVGIENIQPEFEKEVQIQAIDKVDLLIRWLNELIFIFSTQGYLFSEFEISFLSEEKLKARMKGERYKEGKHEIKMEIKAATYHNVRIKKEDLYITTIIFDV